ncbi:MAG: hypothetical protein R2706_05715 [Acidimicrobiales bacterium]
MLVVDRPSRSAIDSIPTDIRTRSSGTQWRSLHRVWVRHQDVRSVPDGAKRLSQREHFAADVNLIAASRPAANRNEIMPPNRFICFFAVVAWCGFESGVDTVDTASWAWSNSTSASALSHWRSIRTAMS